MLLALDVGFRFTGWSVFKDNQIHGYGLIQTEKSKSKMTRTSDDYAFRSAQIARRLKEIVEAHGVKGIVAELPSGGAQSAKAMVMMGMATAIVASVAAMLELPVEWASPGDVKMATVGRRSASKDEVIEAVIGSVRIAEDQ